ncbi:hypothetical protein ZWY2020_003331 [Hordeum vulgare]|nr:hypothetical protein ZWY2020_003331 [Hordeum vulgare]
MCDDDARFVHASRHCASVVQGLLLECECKHDTGNTLLWAGYSGWLLYTAASARGASFIQSGTSDLYRMTDRGE